MASRIQTSVGLTGFGLIIVRTTTHEEVFARPLRPRSRLERLALRALNQITSISLTPRRTSARLRSTRGPSAALTLGAATLGFQLDGVIASHEYGSGGDVVTRNDHYLLEGFASLSNADFSVFDYDYYAVRRDIAEGCRLRFALVCQQDAFAAEFVTCRSVALCNPPRGCTEFNLERAPRS